MKKKRGNVQRDSDLRVVIKIFQVDACKYFNGFSFDGLHH